MKIKGFMYTVLFAAIVFAACKQPTTPNNPAGNTGSNTELKKQRLYQNIQGLWKHDSRDSYIFFGEYKNEYDPYKDKIFTETPGVLKPYSSYAACSTYERLKEQNPNDTFHGWTWDKFVEKMKESYQEANIEKYKDCLLGVYSAENMRIYIVNGDSLTQAHAQTNIEFAYTRVNTGGSGGAVTLSGNYEIKEANGSTFTMNSGNWTFQYKTQTKNGTYTQSGNELTINYSQGYLNVSAIFTVSKSGETITLTKKSGDATTIISSVFMITDVNAVSNGVVKLAAK
jgi:lipoprotein